MKIHPIIFSGAMVRALRAGRKTQTRRLASSPLSRVEPGDVLYVRESFRLDIAYDKLRPKAVSPEAAIWYDAGGALGGGVHGKLRPAIHMPRWASRLTLLVRSVSIEALRSISQGDVISEGAPLDPNHRDETQDGSNPFMCISEHPHITQSPHAWYHRLWDTLHDADGERWEDNPQVVALTFEVISQNVDHPDTQQQIREG